MGFIARHPVFSAKDPRRAWAVRKAMRHHQTYVPECEFCGRSPIHVHHITPISVAPEKAADFANMLSLCPRCHLTVGHGGNWRHYVENAAQLCEVARIRRRES